MRPWKGEVLLSITCLGKNRDQSKAKKESALSGTHIGFCKMARAVRVVSQEFGCMWGITI